MVPEFVAGTRGSNRVQALPAGNADRSFPENSGKPQNSGTRIYGSRIRRQNPRQQPEPGTARPAAASACRFCLPGEISRSNLWRLVSCSIRRQQVRAGSASRQRRHEFSGEFRKTAEFGNSNLWFPNSSPEPAAATGTGHCQAGGSKWQSALPTG